MMCLQDPLATEESGGGGGVGVEFLLSLQPRIADCQPLWHQQANWYTEVAAV